MSDKAVEQEKVGYEETKEKWEAVVDCVNRLNGIEWDSIPALQRDGNLEALVVSLRNVCDTILRRGVVTYLGLKNMAILTETLTQRRDQAFDHEIADKLFGGDNTGAKVEMVELEITTEEREGGND